MTTTDKTPIVNASEWREPNAYEFQFGAYGWTKCIVFGKSLESALETAAEWLAENAPGLIVSHDEPWDADMLDSVGDPVDHTYTEAGWIPSWEWTVDELDVSGVRDSAMVEALAGQAYFDRWDVVVGWYHYLANYHGGQGSREYARLSKLTGYFRLGNSDQYLERISDNAAAIYAQLVAAR